MDCSRIFLSIDALTEAYLKVWTDICNLESPTYEKERVNAVSEYLAALSRGRGWKIRRYPQERFGDVVVITMNPNAKKAPVALSGHLDTVHPVGLFGSPAVRREGGLLRGPGVVDCKGGVAAGFLAMHALEACGYTDRPVMMLLQSNEEVGSGLENKETIRQICACAKDAVAFLNLEGCGSRSERIACLERKGVAGFRFFVSGVAAHSSRCAEQGANAIAEAAYKILELEKVKDTDGMTFNCGLIRGGSARNTVPAQCEFDLDVRFADQEQLERAKAIVQEVAETVHVLGCSCRVEMANLRVAMELCRRNLALLELANSAFAENGLTPLKMKKQTGGSDASDVTAFGIPCIDSLGVCGENIHSVNEYAEIASLADSAKRLAAIVTAL